jgi:mannose-6-phosphate isomerase
MRLVRRAVEKPWGRTDLPAAFGVQQDRKVGEIWFEAPDGRALPLLVKYIFTSEKLSVQVHPDDAAARARGLTNGKSECWYVLDAEPGAAIGLGLREKIGRDALRAAALDGSIETLLDWKPAARGDVIDVPAGTIHAIGAGLSLVEIQQPSDATYRLYDYGRPRTLHLDDGVAVATLGPPSRAPKPPGSSDATGILIESPHFALFYIADGTDASPQADRFAVPLRGNVSADGETARFGDCLFVAADEPIAASADAAFLLAVPRGG